MSKPSLYLHIQQGPKRGSCIQCCSPSIFTIGRSRGNSLQIKDPAISQIHISFQWIGEEWAVIDRGSSNGTIVNCVNIEAEKPVVLKTGDVVKIGEDTTMRAEVLQNPSAKPKAKEAASAQALSEGVDISQYASATSKLNGHSQQKGFPLDGDITLRQWFHQTMDQTPKYFYRVSEALIEDMKLESKQFDEYIYSSMGYRDG